ncbi:MAG: tetratricopeptide repeat protein [Methylomonas sp.]|jgi:predicted O-linked N-acetylglucosamine transferase (SPINDLY family)
MKPEPASVHALSLARFLSRYRAQALPVYQSLANIRDHAAAMNFMGLMLLDKKQYAEARTMLEKAVQLAPNIPEYSNNLGALCEEQGEPAQAERFFRQALAQNPAHDETLIHLGYCLQLQHKYAEAIPLYKQALPVTGEQTRTLVNLGKCLEECAATEAAAECYRLAIAIDPGHAIALYNLAGIHQQAGEQETALDYYRLAISSRPDFIGCHYNMGVCLLHSGQYAAAEAALQQALALDAGYIPALRGLGDLCAFQGRIDAAGDYYRRARAGENLPGLRIRLAALLPPIPASAAHITQARNTLTAELEALESEQDVSIADPVAEVRDAFFYLSYHGLNNRGLKTAIARLFERACPDLLWEAPHCRQPRAAGEPIKIGIISKYLHNHSIGKTTRGFFAALPRDLFKVYAIFIPPLKTDEISTFIRQQADEILVATLDLAAARRQIAALELDILFYQDIGMDPFSYFLAYARLAPVQCTSFGHPDTTGIRNMDYFISSELFETAGAEMHYSERLHCLAAPSLLSYYYRPAMPAPLKPRAAFGCADGEHMYVCPQTLFKLHPDFDFILADILRRDPAGKIWILEGPIPHFAELLRLRWQERIDDVAERLIFLPPQTAGDFINLIAVADLMLDIPSFNGMNTNLEAFAAGTPVVAWPGALQRSRHTAGLYLKMGVTECIAKDAADYADIALRLANDKRFRHDVGKRILANNHRLFEDAGAIAEFSRFFCACVGQAV